MTGNVAHRPDEAPVEPSAGAVRCARRLLAGRRLRNRTFGEDLFGEPAWEMLLILFIAHDERRHVTVSDLCAEVPVPTTTAHRWMLTLLGKKLLIRVDDPGDGRRSHVYLAHDTLEKMRSLLGQMR